MACSASGKSFGRGPCPKWPAGREHCPTIPPVGKREELRTRTACRSGQREETGGQRGIRRVFFFVEISRALGWIFRVLVFGKFLVLNLLFKRTTLKILSLEKFDQIS